MSLDRVNPARPMAALFVLDSVRAYFVANAIKTNVVFGFKERTKQINQGVGGGNRIVIIPGRLPNGDDGDIVAAVGPGGNPRKLWTQEKIVTFSLWAGAPSADSVNEESLSASLDVMQAQIFSALQDAIGNNATWRASRFNADPIETRFGLEYLIELSISATYRALEQGVIATPTPIVNKGPVTIPAPTGT